MNRQFFPLVLVTIAVSTFLATSAFAQATTAEPRVGIGVAFSDVSELITVGSDQTVAATLIPGVQIPIHATHRLRVEPEVGGYRYSSTTTSFNVPTSRTNTFLRIGVGAFWLETKDRVTIYYGGRASYLRFTQSSTVSGREAFTYPSIPGKSFAPTVGGEYRLSDHFRLGGEVQVRIVSWDTTSVLSPNSTTSGNSVSTHGAFALRFFF